MRAEQIGQRDRRIVKAETLTVKYGLTVLLMANLDSEFG